MRNRKFSRQKNIDKNLKIRATVVRQKSSNTVERLGRQRGISRRSRRSLRRMGDEKNASELNVDRREHAGAMFDQHDGAEKQTPDRSDVESEGSVSVYTPRRTDGSTNTPRSTTGERMNEGIDLLNTNSDRMCFNRLQGMRIDESHAMRIENTHATINDSNYVADTQATCSDSLYVGNTMESRFSFDDDEEVPNCNDVETPRVNYSDVNIETPKVGFLDGTKMQFDMKKDLKQVLSSLQDFTRVNDSLTKINDFLQRRLEWTSRQLEIKTKECLDMTKKIAEKSSEVADLRERLAKLTTEMSLRCWDRMRAGRKSLILSDSLLRDVDNDKLADTDIKVLPGGKTNDALNYLNKVENPLNCVYLCIGTNDCTTDNVTIEQIRDSYVNLINSAKKRAEKIVVSSIPPRLDGEANMKNVESMNAALVGLCSEMEITFVDHTDSFMLRQGEVNDGYLHKDGVHLTEPGTQRLIKNLRIPLKDDKSGVCKVSRQHQANVGRERKVKTPNQSAGKASGY